MSKKIHNPHDKFVRETFSDPERAQAFVEEFLPEKIVNELDLSCLKVSQDSYLDNEMKEYFSDLILKIPVKKAKNRNLKIAFLFEHKSSPDNYVLFQVGHYLFSHYFKIIRQNKKLELLIPLIYYQGKQKWEVPSLLYHFKEYPGSFKEYIPQLEYLFIALNLISQSHINTIRNSMLAASITAQKLIENPVSAVKDFNRILSIFPSDDKYTNFLNLIVVYIFEITDITEKELADVFENISPPIKDKVMTTYDRLIHKGKIEEKIKMTLSFFDDGIGIPQLAKAARISEEEVVKILKDNGRKV